MTNDFELRDVGAGLRELRSEVALLRRATERLSTEAKVEVPDYAPTLGKITRALTELSEVVASIAAAPAIHVTSADIAKPIAATSREVSEILRRDLGSAVASLSAAAARQAGLYEQVVAQRRRLKELTVAMAAGAAIGATLWISAAPPIARALPEVWRLPERMAANALDRPRWESGMRLLETSDRAAFADLLISWRIYVRNRPSVEGCLDEARRTQRDTRCSVRIQPP